MSNTASENTREQMSNDDIPVVDLSVVDLIVRYGFNVKNMYTNAEYSFYTYKSISTDINVLNAEVRQYLAEKEKASPDVFKFCEFTDIGNNMYNVKYAYYLR